MYTIITGAKSTHDNRFNILCHTYPTLISKPTLNVIRKALKEQSEYSVTFRGNDKRNKQAYLREVVRKLQADYEDGKNIPISYYGIKPE